MSNEEEEILSRPVPTEEEDAQRVRLKIRRRVVGRRLDKYLHGRFPRLSRTLIQRLIKQGAVTVNDKLTKASYEPEAGDVVDVLGPPPEPTGVVPYRPRYPDSSRSVPRGYSEAPSRHVSENLCLSAAGETDAYLPMCRYRISVESSC